MFKLIKRNQKKILAVFAAGLMVAFTLPTFFGQGNQTHDATVGYIGNVDLNSKRVQQAHNDWEYLRRYITVDIPDQQGRPAQPRGIAEVLLGPSAVAQITENPEMFALLVEEARLMGVSVSNEMVTTRLMNDKNLHVPLDTDGQPEPAAIGAMRSLMQVTGAFDRVAAAAHASRTERDHNLANLQEVAVNLVEFTAKDYLDKVPAHLDEKELQAHFAKYKDTLPGASPASPWGFGYKVPNQVRVQYLMLEDEKVRGAVEGDLSTVDVIKYYKLHPDKFPTTAPTPKTLQDYKLPAPEAPAKPTTQQSVIAQFFNHAPTAEVAGMGFDHYRDEVRKTVISDRAADLTKQIVLELSTAMNADYVAMGKLGGNPAAISAPASTPTSAPTATNPTETVASTSASSLGPPYASKDYLDKLALRIQAKYKVLPTVQTIGELKDAKQLAELPGIGKSRLSPDEAVIRAIAMSRDFSRFEEFERHLGFGNYATSFVAPLMTAEDTAFARDYRVPTLAVYQPSAALEDLKKNLYIFRVIQAVPAHAPAALADVAAQVETDARLLRAYDLALADAQKFLAKSRTDRLQPAANADNRSIIATDLFGGTQSVPPDYNLPNPKATNDFLAGVYNTLSLPSAGDPQHPVGLIELKGPDVARVLVTEIAAAQPLWKKDTLVAFELGMQSRLLQQAHELLREHWYQFDDLAKRLNYRPATPHKSQPTQPQQPAPADPFLGMVLPY